MSDDTVCERHDVESLPSGYYKCPYCEMERYFEAQEWHMATRDPMVEPW